MNQLTRRQIILIGALVIMLIYYFVDSGIFSSKEVLKAVKPNVSETEATKEVDNIDVYTRLSSVAEISWSGDWTNDPFFYATTSTSKNAQDKGLINKIFGSAEEALSSNFSLTGISWLGNSGFALINESVVKEGDVIGGYTVDRIAFNYVILKQGMKTIRLSLNE